jgi:M6 family metalloprotease-like protein
MGEIYIMRNRVKIMHLIVLLTLCSMAYTMVPPHPAYKEFPLNWEASKIEMLPKYTSRAVNGTNSTDVQPTQKNPELPQNILALMVDFSDVQFRTAEDYPDSLNHDSVFFERWMLHLSDFFADASHGQYELSYTVHPQYISLPRPMSYYGADTSSKTDARLPQILPDIMAQLSGEINFSLYDGLIIFHAGAGQEADIDRERTDSIWSTFLTRKLLQAYFDPQNDEYPGFQTPDGAILTNVVIVPEDEYHDYFPGSGEENASAYLFSIYGVLAHQFAHVLGLPTLFDNDSSNGASQGIGNWGLMGTGVWNASGYVPAQLSAWCRYYLGWDEAIEINSEAENLTIDHFLNHQKEANRLYKVNVSAEEYFLIENRQQNPDGSMAPALNSDNTVNLSIMFPSYSFKVLPEDQQVYYDSTHVVPKFDFMTNRYTGSEWDFFLPGYGLSPETDGSGLLIWHIDENVIAEKFSNNFDLNRVNSDALHKGVDLEEADGYQNLDTAVVSDYKYGGPDDSFRAGNNDYFGDRQHNGVLWFPTSQSYYGGIPLEIYDISKSGNIMNFSIRFAWKLDAGYMGESTLPAAPIDFDGDGIDELFYPMPNGRIALFSEEAMMPGFPIQFHEIEQLYTWDGSDLYIPMQVDELARLARVNKHHTMFTMNLNLHRWISHPVDSGDDLFLPLYDEANARSRVLRYNKESGSQEEDIFNLSEQIVANLSWTSQKLFALSHDPEASVAYRLNEYDAVSNTATSYDLPIPADSLAIGLFSAEMDEELCIIVQFPSSLYVFNLQSDTAVVRTGFPFVMADSTAAPITIQDWDKNGSLDMILATSNRVYIIDHRGGDMSSIFMDMGLAPDGISAGALALDLDADGKLELVAALNMNRLCLWEEDLRQNRNFPISFGNRGRHLPFVSKGIDNEDYLWIASNNGNLFRTLLPDYDDAFVDKSWISEYANLQRTAYRGAASSSNQFESSGAFVMDELYFYPNPLKKIYKPQLKLSVMPTEDMQIELAIYDVSGNLVYKQSGMAFAYLRNLELFDIPADKLSSGIYFALISGGGETHRLRFGIEK